LRLKKEKVLNDQTYVSAKNAEKEKKSRVFGQNDERCRTQCYPSPPRQRQEEIIRINTITRAGDFDELYKHGQKLISSSFVIFTKPTDSLSYAVVASKKTIGNAVKRNRAKRRLRELIRAAAKENKLDKRKLVVVARAALLSKDFKKVQEEFGQCLPRFL
jgi:ribonuclease P protein component